MVTYGPEKYLMERKTTQNQSLLHVKSRQNDHIYVLNALQNDTETLDFPR